MACAFARELRQSSCCQGAGRAAGSAASDLDFRHARSHMKMVARGSTLLNITRSDINAIYSLQNASRTVRIPLNTTCTMLVSQLMRHAACPSRRTTTSRTALPLLFTALANHTSSEM